MIAMTRAETVPQTLCDKGTIERDALVKIVESELREISSDDFKSSVYGAQDVRKSLKISQNKKCCYCESTIEHVANFHVEHFRPKTKVCQSVGEAILSPGYYWLAYEWTNLLLICPKCNRNKWFQFPLEDPSKRARSPADNLEEEKPILLNPMIDNPEDHIGFREECPFPRSACGESTITVLKLDRKELNEERRSLLEMVKHIYTIAYLEPPHSDRQKARDLLRQMASPSGKYSSAVRWFICELETKYALPHPSLSAQ